ncbi:MAG: HAD-IIIC family phosphatase [Candidatus Abyssobacteria bacterium SURF_5]|uniref:HAD-IIIC family phosphatase n=1 Tax=Abyssobacteria bacterium (strain SURF_5) TaxID=2093360 RepID=A0A3A4N9I6_ABYX5|nr:MAG: HAD-IIIC family phosphatase [Candidatus Abyssubacteria bacterium SURF_5]
MKAEQKREEIKAAKSASKEGKHQEAFQRLRGIADPYDDFSLQSRYAKVYQTIRGNLGLRPIRLALVGGSTLEHFSDVLAFWLAMEGFRLELYLSPYDTMRQTILDAGSDLYAFNPELVWIFCTEKDVRISLSSAAGHSPEIISQAVQSAVQECSELWQTINSRCSAYIIQNNADLPCERIFGNLECAVDWSRLNLLRRFNLELASRLRAGITILDFEYISSAFGKYRWFDHRYWFHSKHAFSLDAAGLVAFHAARLIGALKGAAKKCIVLDLDNTLWGGVVGDDGLAGIRLGVSADGEAFVAFQEYLKGLADRGVLLAVCSKNEDGTAKEPFLKHPDMRLKLQDISVFIANWNNKADNICTIAKTLNIGLDSLVFIDDNPAERELVRSLLPMVTVPEMPEDPADYIRTLDRLSLFETVSFSSEDRKRGQMYRENAARQEHQEKFTDLTSFLASLDMEATVGSPDAFHVKRMSQLINKSNQFHLTGTRYTESQIEGFAADPDYMVRYFKLKDKFGDNGLISVVVLKREQADLLINTWVMSCRVLSRGMEEFICNEILSLARNGGCSRVLGCYVPSSKNQLVQGLFGRLQFRKVLQEENGATHWEYVLEQGNLPFQTHIRRSES